MPRSQQVSHHLGKSTTGRAGYASGTSDAGTATHTSHLLPGSHGHAMASLGTSSIRALCDLAEVESSGSSSPTDSLSVSFTPSVTSEAAAVSSADIEALLRHSFGHLTLQETARSLSFLRKLGDLASSSGSSAETESWAEADSVKIGDNRDTRNEASQQGGTKPSLANWQALCRAVGVTNDAVPRSITQCKKVRHLTPLSLTRQVVTDVLQTLRHYNVNLYDVKAALRKGTVARTFSSTAALAHYSKREGKLMPKAEVKTDPLLKGMLRDLFGSDQAKDKAKGKNQVKGKNGAKK